MFQKRIKLKKSIIVWYKISNGFITEGDGYMNNPYETKLQMEQQDLQFNNRTNKEITKENVLKLLGKDIDSIAEYLNMKIQGIELEKAPGDSAVKESLYHTPKEIEYLGQEIAVVEIEIQNKELDIQRKKEELKLTKSKKRKEIFEKYMEDSKNYMPAVKKEIEEFKEIFGETKLPSTIVQEIIKNHKPDKPTTTYLDDMAAIATEQEEKEIHSLEEQLLDYKKMRMLLKLVEQKFIDKKFATMKHASLLEAELRNFLT